MLALVLLGVGCRNPHTPPVLTVPPIDMSRLTEHRAFGYRVKIGRSPDMVYLVRSDDVEVRAVMSGIVTSVERLSESAGDSITLQEFRRSQWQVSLAHVFNPTVAKGDQVVAGQILGTVGENSAGELGTTLSVLNRQGDNGTYHCPMVFGSDSFVELHRDFPGEWCAVEAVNGD